MSKNTMIQKAKFGLNETRKKMRPYFWIKTPQRIAATLFILSMACLAAPLCAGAQQYIQISAEVTQINYNEKDPAKSHWSFPVTCTVGTNEIGLENRRMFLCPEPSKRL